MDDFTCKKIIAYGIGALFIFAWAILKIIPYNISMYLATFSYIAALRIESQQHIELGFKKKGMIKFGLALFLLVGIILIILFTQAD